MLETTVLRFIVHLDIFRGSRYFVDTARGSFGALPPRAPFELTRPSCQRNSEKRRGSGDHT